MLSVLGRCSLGIMVAVALSTQMPAQTVHANTSGPPLNKEVIGLATNSGFSSAAVGYTTWNYSDLSSVAFYGIYLVPPEAGDINLDVWQGTGTWANGYVDPMIQYVHNQGKKVLVTFYTSDFDRTGSDSGACRLGLDSQFYINKVSSAITSKGLDGVAFEFEVNDGTCSYLANATVRSVISTWIHNLRAAIGASQYITVLSPPDAGTNPNSHIDIATLAPDVDSFWIQDYTPSYLTGYTMGPAAPLSGYTPNVSQIVTDYLTKVSANKLLVGIPYFGLAGCVSGTPATAAPNATPSAAPVRVQYIDVRFAIAAPGSADVSHRDANDPRGQEPWDSLYGYLPYSSQKCTEEIYWDDIVSLGHKYDLVNLTTDRGLRGVAIHALNYGGSSPELWNALADHFRYPWAQVVLSGGSQSSEKFTISVQGTFSSTISSFDILQVDDTDKTQGIAATGVAASSLGGGLYGGTATVYGFPGHTYRFRARAYDYAGLYPSLWSNDVDFPASTAVSPTAPYANQFKSLYTVGVDGTLLADLSPPIGPGAAFSPGSAFVRAAQPLPGPNGVDGGATLGYNGWLYPYGGQESSLTFNGLHYFSSDVARDFAFLPDGSGGYVLTKYGDLIPFGVGTHAPPGPAQGNPHWTSDVARKVVIFSDGTGGYVLDYTGVPNPFGIGHAAPASPRLTRYWPDQDFARDIVLIPGTHSGYVMNGWAGLYPFQVPGDPYPTVPAGYPYWPGYDVARAVWLLPGATAGAPGGFIMDCNGGLSQFGNAAPPGVKTPQWSGCTMAKDLVGA